MNSCPFQILGLEISASLADIDRQWRHLMLHVHPDKTQTSDDDNAKILNDARDKAKQIYDSYECQRARLEKEHRENKRKREIYRIVQQIYKNQYEKTCSTHPVDPFFEKEMKECTHDIRKEAEDIVENGIGDSYKRLKATEHIVLKLKEEIENLKHDESIARNSLLDLKKESESTKELYENKLTALEGEIAQLKQARDACSAYEKRKCSRQKPKKQRKIFRDEIDFFIQSQIKLAGSDSFVQTKQLIDAFVKFQKHPVDGISDFTQEISRRLTEIFPSITRSRDKDKKIRGYQGISLQKMT